MLGLMKHRERISAVAGALALIAALAFVPVLANAAPSTAVIKDKKAAQAAILTDIDAMRIDLQERTDRLTSIGHDMQDAQTEIDQVTAQLAAVDTQLQNAKTALADRAAALYRSDRVGLLELLLGSRNIEDLIVRTHYLLLVSEQDANMLNDYRLTRSESAWLQDSLNRRMTRLQALQAQADAQRSAIDTDIAKATARAQVIGADINTLLYQQQVAKQAQTQTSGGGGTGTDQFDPNTLITETNFRSQDMTASEIQTWLGKQQGRLASYSGLDYAGRSKTAAEMIADAGKHFNISPRVILVTLQKEQSLLSATSPSQNALNWAMGCGKTDSRTIMKYKGFGKQIWWGAQKLDKNSKPWHSGISLPIDGSTVYPTNAATYSQYKYTPHFRGTHSFWTLWVRYFFTSPSK